MIIDETPEYEVEEVVDSRMFRNKLQYLVHWKGYPVSERTWEPAAHMAHAQELVADFHRKHPSAPRPLDRQRARALFEIMCRYAGRELRQESWMVDDPFGDDKAVEDVRS